MRLFAASAFLTGLLSVLLLAAPAGAESPEARRHGEACPPTGCAGASRSSAASSLGFAAAALATGLIGRRRASCSR